MGMAHAALMVLLAAGLPAWAEEPQPGQIGVRYQLAPEGMVLTQVNPGMGAAAAGLRGGDLVIAIDGESTPESYKAVAGRVRGPMASTVKLTVRAPLGGPEREVVVTRGGRVPRPASKRMHQALAHFRSTLRRGKSPAVAREATESLIAATFADLPPKEAIGNSLNRAVRQHPRVARAALSALTEVAGEDAGLHQRVGEAHFFLGEHDKAAKHLGKALTLSPPDVQGDGFAGDVGARFALREMLARALVELGEQEQAAAMADALAPTRDLRGLYALMDLEPKGAGYPIRASLPLQAPIQTTLMDGSSWDLVDRYGKVVLIAYWATWCGPCKREMPELAEMWEERADQPFEVLAVSVDSPGSEAKIRRSIKQWGMRFPVAHDPGLGARMKVSGLPSVRLIGASGSLRFSGAGYSPTSVARLAKRVDALLEEQASASGQEQGQVVGQYWTRGQVSMDGFVGVPGARSVAGQPGGAVVGVRDAFPVVLGVEQGRLAGMAERDVSTKHQAVDGWVGWLDGPVASTGRGWWVRHLGDDDWFITVPGPVSKLVVSAPYIWVALKKQILVLNGSGAVVTRFEKSAADLAPIDGGGVWVVDGEKRYRLTVSGMADSSEAANSSSVSSDGRWAGAGVEHLISGRFGPDGAMRTVAQRKDGEVVILDGEGQPAFSLRLLQAPSIAIHDVDDDGRDELLVVIRGQGVATLRMELP